MSERTAFVVVNKRGKVVEYTSRIPYQYGQVFYKGDIYQLKNPLPGMKAKRIIMLGTGYPASHKKAIMKSPRKSSIKVKPTFTSIMGEEATNLFQEIVDENADEVLNSKEDVDYNIEILSESIDEGWMEDYERARNEELIQYLEEFKIRTYHFV